MASKLQVTLTKLQVTLTKLQVTPTKLQVTPTKLQVTRSKPTSLGMVEKTECGVRSLSQLKCFFRFGGDF